MKDKTISFLRFNSNPDKYQRIKLWLKFLDIGERGLRKESEEMIDEHYKLFPDCDKQTHVIRYENAPTGLRSVAVSEWLDLGLKPTYRIFKRNEFEYSLEGFKEWLNKSNPRIDNARNLYTFNVVTN